MKTDTKKTVKTAKVTVAKKVTTKVKKTVKKAVAFIRKEFAEVKKLVLKLQKSDLDKINAACQKTTQDIRLGMQSCSGVKILNLHYAGALKKFKGKQIDVLKMTNGVLHTFNASDRKLMTVLGYLTGSDKVDVIKWYTDGKNTSHRKSLVMKLK